MKNFKFCGEAGNFAASTLVLLLFLFGLDIFLHLGVTSGGLYVLAIILSMRAKKVATVYIVASVSTVLTIIAFLILHGQNMDMEGALNRLLGIALVWASAVLIARLKYRDARITADAYRADSMIKTALDGFIVINIHGDIIFANDAAVRIFGYSRSELMGRKIATLTAAYQRIKDKGELLDYLFKELAKLMGKTGQYEACRANGEIFPIELSATALVVGGEQQFLGVVRDITEQVRSQQEIQQFKSTLDRTMDCVFMFRPDTLKFFYVNEGAKAQIEYSEDELKQMTPVDLKPNFTEQEFRTVVQPLIDGPEHITRFETIHRSKSGRNMPVEIFLQYMPRTEHDEDRFIAIVRDISERKKVDRMKREFIASVSHELRTPLTSIRGAIGMIRSGAIGEVSEKTKKMLDVANNNADRLIELVNDLLDFEGLQSGKMTLNIASHEMNSVVAKAVLELTPFAEKHGVELIFSPGTEIRADVDDFRIGQVVTNLISNAVKFSKSGSKVKLKVENLGEQVKITVADKGAGIPAHYHIDLFERFTQASGHDAREKGGTGLGLAISKSIIDYHGGIITFETEVGKGSSFYVTLPIEHQDVFAIQ